MVHLRRRGDLLAQVHALNQAFLANLGFDCQANFPVEESSADPVVAIRHG